MKCEICKQEPSPACDWQQGRCPHRIPLFNIQPKDTSRGHFYVSFVKSLIRVGAGSALILGSILLAGVLFIVAEILGVIEEIV